MESQDFGQSHPSLSNEDQSNQMKEANCSRCGNVVSGPSFSCFECGSYLNKKCTEAPSEIEHIAIKDPLIFSEDVNDELASAKNFESWTPLLGSQYFSPDSGFNLECAQLPREINHPFHNEHPLILQFNGECFCCDICQQEPYSEGFMYFCSLCEFALHIKCAKLPAQINLPCHRKHPLILQLNTENLPCKTCQETQQTKFVYCCSPCKFALHIECASPPLTIKEKCHQHPFTLFWRQFPFICDACGLEENYVAYICAACNLLIHKKCISLPPIIKVPRHYHPIFRNYFLPENEFKNWDCSFCDTEVNTESGSYYCSDCNFISHVKCATEKEGWYQVIEAKDTDEKLDDDSVSVDPIICVIEKNESGEMTKIKHFSHEHDLILSDNIMENDKCCDGCMLLISNSFYYCSAQCDFFLHKTCSKLLRKKHLWSHRCLQSLVLIVGCIFKCKTCACESNGFSYKCNACNSHYCLRCKVGDYRTKHQGHEHPLFYHRDYEGQCNACGDNKRGLYRCKRCNFNLKGNCLKLPLTERHKCDEHPLSLTYGEGNDYTEYHYCDICEKERDPNHWFYHCAICETSAHPKCVVGKKLSIKPGSIYKEVNHPHPLIFVKKTYYYPACCKCCKPCLDLALECAESKCNYIIHWECVKPPGFGAKRPIALCKAQTDAMEDGS